MAVSQDFADKLTPPKPARSFVPDWYRKADRFIGGKMQLREGGINKDLKLCLPFLDALTSGYCLELNCDLLVERDSRGINFFWHEEPQPIETRPKDMAKTLPTPSGHDSDLYAWRTVWAAITPLGYSAIYTHPLNRFDLPFTTTSGVMDTDFYHNGGQIPFFLKEGFTGVIEAGTPIVQIIPFKRESWQHEIADTNSKILEPKKYSVQKHLFGGYKKLFWQKKEYK